MKNILSILLGLSLPLSICFAQETSKVEMSPAARRVLDKKYPGWKFPKVNDEIREFLKKSDDELNLVQGDFDGNGQLDYALQIEHGVGFYNGTTYPKIHFIALLQKAGKYKLQIVDAEGGGNYLMLWEKGDEGYSYETQKNFIFANDAVEAIIFEKAGTSYVYEKGKFRAIITGD